MKCLELYEGAALKKLVKAPARRHRGSPPRLELLEATSDDSPISKFLAKRGPGIHHIALRVEDIRATLADLKSKGARLIDEEPRTGAGGCLVAFVHPSSMGGVLIELVENVGGKPGHE